MRDCRPCVRTKYHNGFTSTIRPSGNRTASCAYVTSSVVRVYVLLFHRRRFRFFLFSFVVSVFFFFFSVSFRSAVHTRTCSRATDLLALFQYRPRDMVAVRFHDNNNIALQGVPDRTAVSSRPKTYRRC